MAKTIVGDTEQISCEHNHQTLRLVGLSVRQIETQALEADRDGLAETIHHEDGPQPPRGGFGGSV